MPGSSKDVGIYLPKKKTYKQRQQDKFKRETNPSPINLETRDIKKQLLTPKALPRRGANKKRRRNKKKKLSIPFDTKHPLDFASSLGSRISEVRRKLRSRIRGGNGGKFNKIPDKSKRRKSKHFPRRRSRPSVLDTLSKTTPPPYAFQEPDFSLPPLEEYLEQQQQPSKRTRVPENPYVPNFLKELLAKAFLKNPEAYIDYLRRREERKGTPGQAAEGYIDWVGDEPYFKTPPPPLSSSLTSGEVRELIQAVKGGRQRPRRRNNNNKGALRQTQEASR